MVKKLHVTLMVMALALVLVPASAFASIRSEKVKTAPVIDGELDDVWQEATPVVLLPQRDAGDMTAELRSVWTDGNILYFFATIVGDQLEDGDPSGPWRSDATEWGFAIPTGPNEARRVKIFTYQVGGEDGAYIEHPGYVGLVNVSDFVTSVTKPTENGWVVEIRVDLNHEVFGGIQAERYRSVSAAWRLNRRNERTDNILFDYPHLVNMNRLNEYGAISFVDKIE